MNTYFQLLVVGGTAIMDEEIDSEIIKNKNKKLSLRYC